MPATELQPFTAAHRSAVERCRFATPNLARDRAWLWTDDEEIVRLLVPTRSAVPSPEGAAPTEPAYAVGAATRYRRSSEPEVYEWEIIVTHPDGVAFICDLVDKRHA